MKTQNLRIIVMILAGLTAAACRPIQKDPPLTQNVSRQDVNVAGITLDPASPLQTLGVTSLWKKTSGKAIDGTRVRIAIVGTGVDYTIPDLHEALWNNAGEMGDAKFNNGKDDDENDYKDDLIGYDFFSGDPYPYDWHGYDTYVASVIAASGHTNSKVVGVAPNAELMILRYIGPEGKGKAVDAALALDYALKMGAKVIYFNWPQGGFGKIDTGLVLASFKDIEKAGIPVVMPAGNGANQDIPQLMKDIAALQNVIVVAGLEKDGSLNKFSNSGKSYATIGAPIDAVGFYPGGVVASDLRNSGIAAAYVTGIVALVSTLPKMGTPQKIKAALLAAASHPAGIVPDVLAEGGVFVGGM